MNEPTILYRGSRRAGESPIPGWLLLLFVLAACSSPNRGHWSGDFDGSVSGVVEFEINARGTRIKGKMTGKTVNGEDFRATLEGILRQDFINADFQGLSQSSFGLPLRFKGNMTGSLARGAGAGDWKAELLSAGTRFRGAWRVTQTQP